MARLVERWLETFSCGHYASTFEDNGFKTLQSVCLIDDKQLSNMGIVSEHNNKIIERVAVLRQSYIGKLNHYSSYSPPSSLNKSKKQIFKDYPCSEYEKDKNITLNETLDESRDDSRNGLKRCRSGSRKYAHSNGFHQVDYKEDPIDSESDTSINTSIDSSDLSKTVISPQKDKCSAADKAFINGKKNNFSKCNGVSINDQSVDKVSNSSNFELSENKNKSRRSMPISNCLEKPSKLRKVIDDEKLIVNEEQSSANSKIKSNDSDFDKKVHKSSNETVIRTRRSAPPSIKYKDFVISPPKKKSYKDDSKSNEINEHISNNHSDYSTVKNSSQITNTVLDLEDQLPKSSDDSSNTDETIINYMNGSDNLDIDFSLQKINSAIDQLNSKKECNGISKFNAQYFDESLPKCSNSFSSIDISNHEVDNSNSNDNNSLVTISSDGELSRETNIGSEASDYSKHSNNDNENNQYSMTDDLRVFNFKNNCKLTDSVHSSLQSSDDEIYSNVSRKDSKTNLSVRKNKLSKNKNKTALKTSNKKSPCDFGSTSPQNHSNIFEKMTAKYNTIHKTKCNKTENSAKNHSSDIFHKANGPSIRVTGSIDTPEKCIVINRKDQFYENEKQFRKYSADFKHEKLSDTQSSNLAKSSLVWNCCFCKRDTHMNGLGDLFGPYHTEFNSSSSDSIKSNAQCNNSPKSNKNKSLNSQSGNDNCSNTNTSINTLYETWLHAPCAVWTHGVCLSGGKVMGLNEALSMSQDLICSSCNKNGATLGCLMKNCHLKYHFLCAIEQGCELNEENFTLLCQKHKSSKCKSRTSSSNGS